MAFFLCFNFFVFFEECRTLVSAMGTVRPCTIPRAGHAELREIRNVLVCGLRAPRVHHEVRVMRVAKACVPTVVCGNGKVVCLRWSSTCANEIKEHVTMKTQMGQRKVPSEGIFNV